MPYFEFADDIDVFSEGITQAQGLLMRSEPFLAKIGLNVSAGKTTFMACNYHKNINIVTKKGDVL